MVDGKAIDTCLDKALTDGEGIAGTSTTRVEFAAVPETIPKMPSVKGISAVHDISFAGPVPQLRRFSSRRRRAHRPRGPGARDAPRVRRPGRVEFL